MAHRLTNNGSTYKVPSSYDYYKLEMVLENIPKQLVHVFMDEWQDNLPLSFIFTIKDIQYKIFHDFDHNNTLWSYESRLSHNKPFYYS